MRLEILNEMIWIENEEDFSKCENLWAELCYDKGFKLIDIAYKVSKVTEIETREYLQEDAALKLLKEGKVLRLPTLFIRKISDKPKCSNCGSSYKKECKECNIYDKFQDMNYYIKNEYNYSELGDWISDRF